MADSRRRVRGGWQSNFVLQSPINIDLGQVRNPRPWHSGVEPLKVEGVVDFPTQRIGVCCDKTELCPLEVVCGGKGRIPCLDLSKGYDEKLRLCDALEQIADSLPSRVDRLVCLRVANHLVPLLQTCHRYEEDRIFPLFESADAGDPHRRDSVNRLRSEHVEDEFLAHEITEVLFSIGHGGPVENPEAVGFMLRTCFQSLRRHIAFEREHILPIVAAFPEKL